MPQLMRVYQLLIYDSDILGWCFSYCLGLWFTTFPEIDYYIAGHAIATTSVFDMLTITRCFVMYIPSYSYFWWREPQPQSRHAGYSNFKNATFFGLLSHYSLTHYSRHTCYPPRRIKRLREALPEHTGASSAWDKPPEHRLRFVSLW